VGYYVVVQFETPAKQLAEFERLIKLDESVLRHLVVIDEGATPAVARPVPEEEADEEAGVPEEADE
jgi:ribosomal protein S6